MVNVTAAMDKKRKRNLLSPDRKREIVKYAENNTKKTHLEIANNFSCLWKTNIVRRTVGDIIAQKEKWSEESDKAAGKKRKLNREARHNDMEKALYEWIINARAKNVPLTDAIIREKAQFFGEKIDVRDFAYSNGWLHRFKSRFALKSTVIPGESAGVNPAIIDDGRATACM